MRRGVRAIGQGAALAVAGSVLVAAPALADSTVVVRGTDFPEGRAAQLSFVGCEAPYTRTLEPIRPAIGRGPGTPPAGERSLFYDLAGGNALGSLHYVDSMVGTRVAELAVHAPEGARGVVYAGYQEPDDGGTRRVWLGRAEVSAPAGRWHTVDAAGLAYTWTQYDVRTWRVLDTAAAAATVPVFAATHGGDGAGLYSIGFGCDGRPFHLDALRVGAPGAVTTYDLEGLLTSAAISVSTTRVTAGGQVTLAGALRDGTGDRLARATMVLEARPFGSDSFETVQVLPADAADPALMLTPTVRTVYRWRFADRPLAEGSLSDEVVVEVVPVLTLEQALDEAAGVLRLRGTLTPARPDVTVTLWRQAGAGAEPVPVGTAPTGADGGFTLDLPVAQVRRGDRLFVTVPAGGGLLAAGSPRLVVPRAADPSPGDPSPSEPSPTDPSPTGPSPSGPSPSDPSPTGPSPAGPGADGRR